LIGSEDSGSSEASRVSCASDDACVAISQKAVRALRRGRRQTPRRGEEGQDQRSRGHKVEHAVDIGWEITVSTVLLSSKQAVPPQEIFEKLLFRMVQNGLVRGKTKTEYYFD
jgi:hypothetical protein